MGSVTVGHILTQHIGIILFKEILTAVVDHVPERGSTGLHENTVLIDDLTDHFFQRNTKASLFQLDKDQLAVGRIQMIAAIGLIQHQLICHRRSRQLNWLQTHIGRKGVGCDLTLCLVSNPRLIFNGPGIVTGTADVQDRAFCALFAIQTDDQTRSTGLFSADAAIVHRHRKTVVNHLFQRVGLHKVRRTVIAGLCLTDDGEFVNTALRGSEDHIRTVTGSQGNIGAACAYIRGLIFLRGLGAGDIGCQRISIAGSSVSHHHPQLGGIRAERCGGFIKPADSAGFRCCNVQCVITGRQIFFGRTVGIHIGHGHLGAVLHKFHNDLFCIGIVKTIYNSDLIRNRIPGFGSILTAGTQRQHGTKEQRTQRQCANSFCKLHK